MNIPKHILDAIQNDETSLFNHEVLSNEYAKKNLIRSIAEVFDIVQSKTEFGLSIKDNTQKLNDLLNECKSIEVDIKDELVKIVEKYIKGVLFPNLDTHINLEMRLMDAPKEQPNNKSIEQNDFIFNNLEEIDDVTRYIYKRRLMNVFITGLSLHYSNDFKWFVNDLFELNTRLPHLYSEINLYNTKLLYLYDEGNNQQVDLSDGYYDIFVGQSSVDDKPLVKVHGYTFSSLLYETIKSILNKVIFNTLPLRMDLVEYVLSRTDAPVFEFYDMRIGHPIVSRVISILEKNNIDLISLNLGFTVQYIMALPYEDFNSFFKELFAGTKRGEELLLKIVDDVKLATSIVEELSQSEEYFTPDELDSEEVGVINEDLHKKVGSSQDRSIKSKRKWVTSRLKSKENVDKADKYAHSTLSYRLYPDMDKDTARSYFSKKVRGDREFDDEEIKKLYTIMKKGL